MKTKIKIIVIVVIITTNQIVNAQWAFSGAFIQTIPTIPGVGIGTMPLGGIQSAFHINTNFTFPGVINLGEVFRTTYPTGTGLSTYWRMETGLAPAVLPLFNINSNDAITDVNIVVEQTGNLNFKFGGAGGTTFMNIMGTGAVFPSFPSFVGISPTGTFTPSWSLDVDGGDINVSNSGNGYRIGPGPIGPGGSSYVLWDNNNNSNIFVGIGAGGIGGSGATSDNTFVGGNAGLNFTTASGNTCLGSKSGELLQTGINNTFTGYGSGSNLNSGSNNTFTGVNSGQNTISGNKNTFVGQEAGFSNIGGGGNSFFGYQAGYNTIDLANTFIGFFAGLNNTTGRFNTTLGFGADLMFPGLKNSTAIGWDCKVPANNQIIMGNNNTYVGIGFSGDNVTFGPVNTLEINADPSSFVYSTIEESGLSFRQLNNTSTANPNTGNMGVLSLDATGKVVYVKQNPGTITSANNGTSLDVTGSIVQFGQDMPVTSGTYATLSSDREVPLNNFNIYFTDPIAPTTGNNRIGIGTVLPNGKVDVENTDNTPGETINTNLVTPATFSTGLSVSANGASNTNFGIINSVTGTSAPYNIGISCTTSGATNINWAGNFYAQGVGATANIGIDALTSDAGLNIGVEGEGFQTAGSPSSQNFGVEGAAHNGLFNTGGSFAGYGTTTGQNIGVYGTADNSSTSNIGIYGYALVSTSAPLNYAGYFDGDVHVNGTLSKTAGSFKIDHPQDPANKYLIHSFVESPDMMNVYNGNITTDANGEAKVDLPTYFQAENVDFKYQLTVIGQFAQAIIFKEIQNNSFVIKTDKPNVKVSWQVTGVRNDIYAQKHRIVAEVNKVGNEKGKYLQPELYGQPDSMSIVPKPIKSPAIKHIKK